MAEIQRARASLDREHDLNLARIYRGYDSGSGGGSGSGGVAAATGAERLAPTMLAYGSPRRWDSITRFGDRNLKGSWINISYEEWLGNVDRKARRCLVNEG